MKRIIVFILLAFVTLFITFCVHITVVSLLPYSYIPLSTFSSEKVLSYIQEYREKNNLPPLIESKALCKIAYERVYDIRETFSHELFYKKFKNYPIRIGENIIKGYQDEFSTFNRWRTSKPHNDLMLSNSTYTCIRCITVGHYCVQIFSTENPE